MKLHDQQRSLQAYLLGRSAAATDARDSQRWALYQSMVQGRIEDMIVAALPRFTARVTQRELAALVRSWLAVTPMNSEFIRDLPGQFARWMFDNELRERDPAAAELIAVEIAFWEVSFAPEETPSRALVDFQFDLAPMINATTRIIETRFRAHRDELTVNEAAPCSVAIFRSPTTHLSRWRELTPFAEALLRRFEIPSNAPASDRARDAAASVRRPVDGELVAELSALLSAWLEDGLLLGSSVAA